MSAVVSAVVSYDTGNQVPVPPVELAANQDAAWVFTIFCIAAAALALAFVLHFAVSKRDALPVVLFLGGGLCGLVEPFGDIIGLTYYPSDTPLMLFTAAGREIPAFVPIGESMFFCAAIYGAYRLFLRGTPAGRLVWLVVAFALFDSALEMFATQAGVYTYYGDNPALILGLPVYAIVQNGAVGIVGAWVILALRPYLHGWRFTLVPFLIPSVFLAQAVACTWPVYLALNTSASPAVMWPLIVFCTTANAALPLLLLRTPLVERYRSNRPPVRERKVPLAVQPAAARQT